MRSRHIYPLVDRLDDHLVDGFLYVVRTSSPSREAALDDPVFIFSIWSFHLFRGFACDKSVPGPMKGLRHIPSMFGGHKPTWVSYFAYSFLENGSYATQPNPPLAPDYSKFIIAVD